MVADQWLGLGVLLAYLLFWNLILSVNWVAWVAPVVGGLAGATLGARRLGDSAAIGPQSSFSLSRASGFSGSQTAR